MNLSNIIPRHARYRPNHPGVVFGEHRLSWRDFNRRVNRVANALLAMGLKKGDKVATLLPNSLEIIDLYWAVAKTGMVIVPLSPMLRRKGLTSLLRDSDSVAVVTTKVMVEHLDPLKADLPNIKADRYILTDSANTPGYVDYQQRLSAASEDEPPEAGLDRDSLYNIMYSSGTTGLPKGIMHSHYVRMMYCLEFGGAFRIAPESVILHTGSLVFNGAMLTFMPAFYHGTTFILHPYFDVQRMIDTIAEEKVTHIVMVPSQIVAMLSSPSFDPSKMQSLEMILTVGAPLHAEHKRELTRQLPGIFYELYGLTEGFITVLDKDMYEAKPESVGVPMPFARMKIVDPFGEEVPTGQVGEITGYDPVLMPGYYKRPDLTEVAVRDGWLYTGDLGYVDEDGFLFLVDRKKDLIISGGINVYPKDIEEILVQHENVIEVAVFGVPDEKWGETPVAAVILADKYASTADELRKWLNDRVEARYQKVREVIIRDHFPRSVAGKTLKRVMRDEFWQDKDTNI